MQRALLLSNSTLPGDAYLSWAKPHILSFLDGVPRGTVLFVPFAGISFSWEEYESKACPVFSEAGFDFKRIETVDKSTISSAAAIVIGGGNTFNLLTELQRRDLIAPIRAAFQSGIPYIGWSAGSNVACPGIFTTNDMPITQPSSFEALALVPFQLNPHFTDATLPNHGGESRTTRLTEYLHLHKDEFVLCLPEGSALRVEGAAKHLVGLPDRTARVLRLQNVVELPMDESKDVSDILR